MIGTRIINREDGIIINFLLMFCHLVKIKISDASFIYFFFLKKEKNAVNSSYDANTCILYFSRR